MMTQNTYKYYFGSILFSLMGHMVIFIYLLFVSNFTPFIWIMSSYDVINTRKFFVSVVFYLTFDLNGHTPIFIRICILDLASGSGVRSLRKWRHFRVKEWEKYWGPLDFLKEHYQSINPTKFQPIAEICTRDLLITSTIPKIWFSSETTKTQ